MKDIRPIIGIAGHKGAGKDTVASIIVHRYLKPDSRYNDWLIGYDGKTFDRAIHFGDKLKDLCADLFNIPRLYFDDRNYKDNLEYCFDNNTFVNEFDNIIKEYHVFDVNENLSECIEQYKGKVAFKLRTLLQYIGTNIFRNQVYKNMWIKHTVNEAINMANRNGFAIISDVRFENEVKAINNLSNGYIIKIERENNNEDNHESENADIEADFVIKNNTSKFALFYAVNNILDIINKKV